MNPIPPRLSPIIKGLGVNSQRGLGFLTVISLSLLFLSVFVAKAQVWGLATDFSVDKNPNGVWTFAWQEKPGGKINPYDLLWGTQKDVPIKGFWAPGWFGPVRAWCATRSDTNEMFTRLPPP